jgi:hypothetical protein
LAVAAVVFVKPINSWQRSHVGGRGASVARQYTAAWPLAVRIPAVVRRLDVSSASLEVANTVPGENDLGRAFFHPGATGCTGNPMQGAVTCAKPNRAEVVFETFDPDADTIVIDVAELFKSTDLEQANECHSTPQSVCSPMFDAWGINWSNGAPQTGQSAFKLQ